MKTFYALRDSRFHGTEPYGVIRFDTATGKIERYNAGGWFYSPSEADMLVDPDPGESATEITEAQAQQLIAGGKLVVISAADQTSLTG